MLRYSLHPRGLGGRLLNLRQWRGYVLDRLERQLHASDGDAKLAELYQELIDYPATNELGAGADDAEDSGPGSSGQDEADDTDQA